MKWMRFSIARLMGFVLIAALGFGGLKAANEYWASGCFTLMVVALVVAILNAAQGRGKDRAYWAGFAISGWIYFVIVFVSNSNSTATYPILPVVVFEKLEPLFHPELSNFSINGTMTLGTTTWTPTPLSLAPLAPPKIVFSSPPTSSPDGSDTSIVTSSPPMIAPPASPAPSPDDSIPIPVPPTSPVVLTPPTPLVTWSMPPPPDLTLLHYSRVAHSLTALLVGMLGGIYSAWLFARRERREANAIPEVSPSSP